MPTALITGASSGIGYAIAEKLAANGYDLTLVARALDRLEFAAKNLRRAGVKVLAIPADVSDSDQIDSAIEKTLAAHHRIDVLVNNAGYAPSLATHTIDNAEWHKILDINLSSAFYATRGVWPIMTRQHEESKNDGSGGGVILNISSMAARDPFPGLGAYAIAKAGINMLTKATANEGAAVGIKVFCIAPAAVETPMLRQLFSEKSLPSHRTMLPADIANVAFSMINGTLAHASGETLYLQRR